MLGPTIYANPSVLLHRVENRKAQAGRLKPEAQAGRLNPEGSTRKAQAGRLGQHFSVQQRLRLLLNQLIAMRPHLFVRCLSERFMV